MTGIITYKTYSFKDKDPVIDEIRTRIQDEAKMQKVSDTAVINMVSETSGLSVGAIRGWLYGDIRRPQHATVAAAMGALGYEQHWVKSNSKRKK